MIINKKISQNKHMQTRLVQGQNFYGKHEIIVKAKVE